MLAAALATHPKTAPGVLDVLTAASDPYTAAIARHRTGHPNPWDVPNLDWVGDGDLGALLNRPGVTPAQRRGLISTIRPDRWATHLAGTCLTTADLQHLATLVLDNLDAHTDMLLPTSLATDPRLPARTALRLLDAVQGTPLVTPAVAVAVADNHHLDPTLLLFDRHPSNPATQGIRDALDAYQSTGRNLVTLLVNAPWEPGDGPSHTPFSLQDITPHTANETVVNQIADRVLSGRNRHDRMAPERVFLRLLRNHNLPAPTRTRLARRALEHAADLSIVTTRVAAATLVHAADPHDAPVINYALKYIPGHTDSSAPQSRPHLNAHDLRNLTSALPTLDPNEAAILAARIAVHPVADTDTRALARTYITPDLLQQDNRSGLGALALDLPLHSTNFPPYPDSDDRALYERALTTFIDQHPRLLTDPDLVRAVLALAPNFTGTLDELAHTAAGISHPTG